MVLEIASINTTMLRCIDRVVLTETARLHDVHQNRSMLDKGVV